MRFAKFSSLLDLAEDLNVDNIFEDSAAHVQSTQDQSSSVCHDVFYSILSSIGLVVVAVLFVVTYFLMSEHHREVATEVHKILGTTDEDLIDQMIESVLWTIDGTLACIYLFLILEDVFLLYELNCEVQYLNSEAYLSLLEAVEVDNRYIKDAIILEAVDKEERDRFALQRKNEALIPDLLVKSVTAATPVTPTTPITPLTTLRSITPTQTAQTPELEEGSL